VIGIGIAPDHSTLGLSSDPDPPQPNQLDRLFSTPGRWGTDGASAASSFLMVSYDISPCHPDPDERVCTDSSDDLLDS
jgi:hypothetical protein